MVTALSLLTACGGNPKTTAEAEKFDYTVEQFADLQILHTAYQVLRICPSNKKNWFII